MESKIKSIQNKTKLIDTENRLEAARGGNGERVGEKGEEVKRHKLPAIKQICHENLMYSTVTIINNTVLDIWKLLRE